ncbi:MAG: 16S rRNA (adenine(1518)-N(6)/adenine(1519)-N(6))-dimethyltransferase RsmA [Parachlamydiaceae bacterium]
MALYKPSELTAFLESLGIAPKKGLSQNFLIDGNIIRNIIAAANLEAGDSVLEVGPGPGALTEALLKAHAHVVAVEMDKTLAEALNRLPHEPGQLKVIQQDILKTPWSSISPQLTNPVKLIANLPYHITTPVLEKFVPMRKEIESIVVMVQDEVGKRMAAEAGTKDFGSLSIFLSFYAKVEYQFKVGRRCFFPAPKVDSAVVKLTLRPTPEGIDANQFFTLTRTAFQQRRKSLRASLKELYSPTQIEEALAQLDLQPLTRPEELSLELWCELCRKLTDKTV